MYFAFSSDSRGIQHLATLSDSTLQDYITTSRCSHLVLHKEMGARRRRANQALFSRRDDENEEEATLLLDPESLRKRVLASTLEPRRLQDRPKLLLAVILVFSGLGLLKLGSVRTA